MAAALVPAFAGMSSMHAYCSTLYSKPALPHQPSRLSRRERDEISELRSPLKKYVSIFLRTTNYERRTSVASYSWCLLFISLSVFIFLCWKDKKLPFPELSAPPVIKIYKKSCENSLECKITSLSASHIHSSKKPAPLDAPSQEELQEFPGARVVEAAEIEGNNHGEKIRMRILETHFKTPYIRTEEIIDQASGSLLHRSEMAATHLLVRLPPEEDPESFLNQLGSDVIGLERVTMKDSLYRLQLGSHSLAVLPRVLDEIVQKKLPLLSREPDVLVHASMIPNNPLYSQQWYLHRQAAHINGPLDYRIFNSGIDACDAWNIRTSAQSVVVAVIDTGIRYTHEDLAANMWHENNPIDGTIYGWNFSVKNDDPKKSDPMDGLGHGTACAGIIGAVGNSRVGVVGVAWNVKLMALKFLNDEGSGTGQISDAVCSIDFACEHGAQILNCSWGYVPFEENQKANNPICATDSTALAAAMSRAQSQGVIVVAAAGNEGKDNDVAPEYPANYSLDNIISVAATTEDNELAWFSNYGATTVHIAAPGEEIFSTWARSDSDYITDQTRGEILGDQALDLNKQPEGTSLSVPQVVGALALLKAAFPEEKNYRKFIRQVIDTSDKIPSLTGKMVGGKLNLSRALADPLK